MTITLNEFAARGRQWQLETLWNHAVLIGLRETRKHQWALYWLSSFYIEVQYEAGREDSYRIKSFISDELLQPYLDQIDLRDLLENI